jgi:2-polyprenyl-3-methyl-5-hydroxy-6-metoxy-1,4-benzoquinol methylase
MITHEKELIHILGKLVEEYPKNMTAIQRQDIPRIAFNISLSVALGCASRKALSDLEICDIGGGIGLFSLGCAALGLRRTVLVDDFNDAVNHQLGDSILDIHRRYGIEVVSRDVIATGIYDIKGRFDIITSFESMEHWHHSPKRLFHQIVEKLKPGGGVVIGVPNCVNMRKRMTVPLGIGKWSCLEEWYERETFRGHVREPDVSDLRYIARDIGLANVQIIGRNWLGYKSPNPAIRFLTKIMDYPLRLRPSLCADIYMTGIRNTSSRV